MLAVGAAMDLASDLRKLASERAMPFVISEPVYQAAGLDPSGGETVTLPASGTNSETTAILASRRPPSPHLGR